MESLNEKAKDLSVADQPKSDLIEINYASGKNAHVVRKNIVKSTLADKNTILFGEGNLTFTFALAAIQGGWSRILSTRFEPATNDYPIPTFDSVKQECVINCVENGNLLDIAQDKIKANIKVIMSLEAPMFSLCGIDATGRAFMEGKVAWFQCPWVSLKEGTDRTAQLIIDFLENMANQQSSGDYVLIGITTVFPYVQSYKLGDLLDFSVDQPGSSFKIASSKCSCRKYDFMGADDEFIQIILQFGYHHQSAATKDIHEKIMNDHITLVFQRNARVSTKGTKDKT